MVILKKLMELVRYVFFFFKKIKITLTIYEIFITLSEQWDNWLSLFF